MQYITIVKKPPCEINISVLQQQQNLARRFGTSKMHLRPSSGLSCCSFEDCGSVVVDSLSIVTPLWNSVIVQSFVMRYFMSILYITPVKTQILKYNRP